MERALPDPDMTSATAWRWGNVEATVNADGTRLTHRTADAQLDVTGGRLVGGPGYAEASAGTRRDLARVGAIVRLREIGRYMIHAAGVVDPKGRGWLLPGDSGAGKSTLAYALARAGWTVLGDDGVVIELAGRTVTALPWKDPLHVSSGLSSEFPELHDHRARAHPRDARQRIPMDARLARAARVSAVLFIERANDLTVARIGALEALGALIRQSPWVMAGDAHSRRHLEALRGVAALPCFHLGHTPAELRTAADVLDRMLA